VSEGLIVVDASCIVRILISSDEVALAVKSFVRGKALYAPTLVDYEVSSALRGLSRKHPEIELAAGVYLQHLAGMPIRREGAQPLIARIWSLRHNYTAYDASYVALAEALDATLVTCDEKFARAGAARCLIETIS
jgi:predicted nucleic acid-binding protein